MSIKITQSPSTHICLNRFFAGKCPTKTVYSSRRCGNENKMGVKCVRWSCAVYCWQQLECGTLIYFVYCFAFHGKFDIVSGAPGHMASWKRIDVVGWGWVTVGFSFFFSLTFFPRHATTRCFWPHYYLCQGGNFFPLLSLCVMVGLSAGLHKI